MKHLINFKKIATAAAGTVLVTSSALATFSFSIDSFSNDELVVTISGSSLLSTAAPASVPALFFFADTDGVSDYLTSPASVSGSTLPGSPTLSISGAQVTAASGTGSFSGGNVLLFGFDAAPVNGDTFGTDVQITFSGVGLFDFDTVDGGLGLYWGIGGAPASPTGGLLQDVQAVPELSTYPLLFGLVALGLVAIKRRR